MHREISSDGEDAPPVLANEPLDAEMELDWRRMEKKKKEKMRKKKFGRSPSRGEEFRVARGLF